MAGLNDSTNGINKNSKAYKISDPGPSKSTVGIIVGKVGVIIKVDENREKDHWSHTFPHAFYICCCRSCGATM